jgi:hypothetical protein
MPPHLTPNPNRTPNPHPTPNPNLTPKTPELTGGKPAIPWCRGRPPSLPWARTSATGATARGREVLHPPCLWPQWGTALAQWSDGGPGMGLPLGKLYTVHTLETTWLDSAIPCWNPLSAGRVLHVLPRDVSGLPGPREVRTREGGH